jgi:hypothetical protein
MSDCAISLSLTLSWLYSPCCKKCYRQTVWSSKVLAAEGHFCSKPHFALCKLPLGKLVGKLQAKHKSLRSNLQVEDVVSAALIPCNSAEFAISADSLDLHLYSHTFSQDGQSRAHGGDEWGYSETRRHVR